MPPCPAACSTSSRIRRLSSAPNLRRRAFAGTSGSGGLAKKGTAILVSLTMILPAALLCNYGRRFCLIDVGTEGAANLDSLGRLQRVVENNAYITDYSYDLRGSLTSVVQGGLMPSQSAPAPTRTRTFVYDSLARMSSASNPESGLIRYVYDKNGNGTQKTDANSTVTNLSYDELNRVLKKTYTLPQGSTIVATSPVDYCYDQESGTVQDPNNQTRNCNGALSSTYSIGRVT